MASWTDLLNTGITSGANFWQSQQGVNAANDAAQRAKDSDEQRRIGLGIQSAQLRGLADEAAAGYTPQYATAKTAFATSQIDPATGKVGYSLDPRAQGLFDKYMQGAQKSVDLAGDMDPKTMAADRYAALQDILNPQRAKEDNARMRMLAAKGITGVATQEGGTGTAMNPYEAAAMAAREQANKKAAYESLGEGEKYLDNLLNRSKGMFSGAQAVEGTGAKALETGKQFSELFTRAKQGQTQAVTALKEKAIDAQRKATYDPAAELLKMNAEKVADNVTNKRSGEIVKAGTGMFSSIGGVQGVLKGISSLFTPGAPQGQANFDWSSPGAFGDPSSYAGYDSGLAALNVGGDMSGIGNSGYGLDY